ncbi:DUF4402 domain-containing protein [Fusobacterium sp.]|uniref:DUF4402 domain-containing protein n=1 Tax=Fusobacterium sp. TaxID=68766 RepID=UPI00262EF632|nr:DUF4402 domain-containing protein [Fusobacterium sp.]
MKKILFGMLAVSSLVLGAEEGALEDKLNVTAKVVKPLQMNVINHVDFGLLTPGQKDKYAEKLGRFEIIGTPGEKISVFIKTDVSNKFTQLNTTEPVHQVTMKTGEGTEANEKMVARLGVVAEGGENLKENLVLSTSGKKEFSVGGWTSAAANQKEGSYKGEMTIKALYE